MADILNKRNKVHHVDAETDEDMYPIFLTDVDGTPRHNKRLLPSISPSYHYRFELVLIIMSRTELLHHQ